MKEKISVIMSVYKESKNELKLAIDSILNQTYSNLEFIIIVDNPEEKWRIDFIKSYNDKRINLIVNKKNIGLPASLNKALSKCTGKYIARMDADDISLPNRLEKQINFLNQNNYDMCGSNVTCFIDGDNFKDIQFPQTNNAIKKLLFVKNCVSHPTYLVKKEVYKKLNGYNNIFSCEDYDFLLRATNQNITIGNVQQILLRYRISPNSISRKNAGKQELIADYLKKYYKNNKNTEVTEQMINDYLSSSKYQKNLKSYDKYWSMKNTRSKYKEHKGIIYYWYTFLLIINIRHSIKEIYRKLYEKYIFINEKREKNTNEKNY